MSQSFVKQFFHQFLMHNLTTIRLRKVNHSCKVILIETDKETKKEMII